MRYLGIDWGTAWCALTAAGELTEERYRPMRTAWRGSSPGLGPTFVAASR
jgi:hypothetical protein